MNHTAIGVDIAKSVFQVHWVDPHTGEVVNKPVKRDRFLHYFAIREPCVLGMEACNGAQHWSRQLTKMGQLVKLMPPKFVKAFNVGNKNGPADARAILMATQIPKLASRSRSRQKRNRP